MSGDLWGALDVRGYEIARFLFSLLWQSSIVLAGVGALAFLLRRRPARVRHALWVVGLLCVPLLPLISWAGSKAGTPQRQVAVIPHYRAQFAPMSEPAYPVLPTRAAEAPDENSRAPAPSLERQAPIPAPHLEPRAAAPAPLQPKPRARIYPWAWGIAACAATTAALLAWVLFGWLQIRRRLRSGRVLNDARVAGILASAQDQTGVRFCTAVIESTADSVPMTFGTFLPVILAPRGLLASLSDEEVRALLVHELAHIRRRDAPMLMLVSLLRAAFFFQPLAWIAARRISILSEQAADDIVVEVTEQPVAYAKTLARLAEELPRRAIGIELSAGFIFSRGAFLSRVKAILADRARVRKLSRWTLVGTVTAVLIAIVIACAVPMGEKRAAVVTENPALRVAADILKNHYIRDAVMLVPNGTWHSAPALADIAGDGTLQVIAPVGEGWVGAWHCDGRPVAGWPQKCGRICCPVAVGDVFHDGKLEIASPGHLWRADGQLVPGWPQGNGNCFCTPSLADLEGDGRLEILSTDFQLGVCVRRGDGTMLPGWPIAVPDNDVRSTPLAYDLNGDGKKEIIFTRGEGEVRIFTADGKPFPGYPRRFPCGFQQGFVLTEAGHLVTGGSVIDLLKGDVTSLPGEGGGDAPCLLKDAATGQWTSVGPLIPSRRTSREGPDSPGWYSDSAVAADIDGDGKVEALFGNRDGWFHAVRQDGTEAAGWPKHLTPSGDSGMAVGNLSGDTLQAVINADGGRIYVFDETAPATTSLPWPTFLANNLRNGMPGPGKTPRSPTQLPSVKAEVLNKVLSEGNWDAAISLYQDAVLTIKQNAAHFDASQAAQLQQAGLLSIARVLNTRAKRFDEAAAQYQEAIAAAPETWSACQALVECTDLVRLHPELAGARDSLQRAVAVYLPVLDRLQGENADLCRYAAAQACAQVDRAEGPALFKSLAQNPSPFVASMAKSFADYDGLPFLLSLSEDHTHSLEVKTKDLTPESKAEGQIQVLLEVDANSPTSEAFPMTLRLKAPADQAALPGANWKAGEDGQLHREVERDLPSAPLGTYRANRELLFSERQPGDWLTVRREVTRVDNRHMHVKVFFQESALKQVEFGFMTSRTGAKIDPSSVSPKGAFFNNEGEVRFNSMGAGRNGMSLADGITVEANIELPAGTKFFYPEVLVRAWGDHEEIQVEPHTATDSVRGQAGKIEYELSSKRRFKVISAKKDDFYWSSLAKLDADAVAQASPAASMPRANGDVTPARTQDASVLQFKALDALGNPIPKAVLQIWFPPLGEWDLPAKVASTSTTDDNGNFDLPGNGEIPRNQVAVRLFHPDYGTAQVEFWLQSTKGNLRFPVVKSGSEAEPRALKGVVLNPENQPVSGALVEISGIRLPAFAGGYWGTSAVTDKDGHFRIYPVRDTENAPWVTVNATYEVIVFQPAYELFPYLGGLRNSEEAVIHLERPQLKHHFVFLDRDGRPAAAEELSRRIRLCLVGEDPQAEVPLPERYAREGGMIAPGRYEALYLETRPVPSTRVTYPIITVTKDSPEELVFQFPPPLTFTGRVVDGVNGKPLAGAFVKCVSVEASGGNNLSDLTAEQWQSLHALPVAPKADDPVVLPILRIYGGAPPVRTDAEGRYTLQEEAGGYYHVIVAFDEGLLPYCLQTQLVKPDKDGRRTLPDAPLFPAAKITLTPVFTAPESNPNQGYVWVRYDWVLKNEGQPEWYERFKQSCARTGNGCIERPTALRMNHEQTLYVPAGIRLQLEFRSEIMKSWVARNYPEVVLLQPGEMRKIEDLTFTPAVPISAAVPNSPAPAPQKGRVLDENEKPIAGASVYIAGRAKGLLPPEMKVLAEATSDADGNFDIPALPDGYDEPLAAFACKAGLAWGEAVFRSDAAGTQRRIFLLPPGSVAGKVLDREGKPIRGVKVYPFDILSQPSVGTRLDLSGSRSLPFLITETDEKGAFRLDNLPAGGRITMAYEAPAGYGNLIAPLPDERNQDLPTVPKDDLEIRLDQEGCIKGILKNEKSGKAAADVWVIAKRNEGGSSCISYAKTDANGEFVLRGLSPGVYRHAAGSVADWRGMLLAEANVTVAAGQTVDHVVLSWSEGLMLEGRVLDAQTKAPLAQVHLYLFAANGRFGGQADTDADGKFRMRTLPGTYTLRANERSGRHRDVDRSDFIVPESPGIEEILMEPRIPAPPAPATSLSLPNATDADLSALEDKQFLRKLDLSGSQITDAGLAHLKDMQGLTDLYIGNTRITDAGLALLKEMKGLQVLDLRYTKITDAGLAHVKEMKGLHNLVLQGNQLTDAGLTELKEMKTLAYLDLWGTKITDAGLASLKEMKGLTGLDLGFTEVADDGLADLKDMKGLQWLDLSRTNVTDAKLTDLTEMKALQFIDLGQTKVTDAGLLILKDMKGLKGLGLGDTQVTDAGLATLKEMKGLQTLFIDSSKVTEAGLADLKAALPKIRIVR